MSASTATPEDRRAEPPLPQCNSDPYGGTAQQLSRLFERLIRYSLANQTVGFASSQCRLLQVPKTMDFAAARHTMVESQLRPNRIVDSRVVEAMATVARENFVPAALRAVAYVDEDIPLGNGRFLMEPMVFARLVQSAELNAGAHVLVVGSGCGYGANVFAHMGAKVVAIENDVDFAAQTRRACGATVTVVEAAFAGGWPTLAPYDAIIFDGAIGGLPEAYAAQVGEGGRILAVVAAPGQPGKATLWQKFAGNLTARVLFDAGTPVLPGMALEPGFVF
jgi:protein-L-isoaspartate(D-aspartate) O-methyltransferase